MKKIPINPYEAAVEHQISYLRKLKSMKLSKLAKLHKETFENSKFKVDIPKWMHRSILEKRLFYYYCVEHYHYPWDSEPARAFRKQAKYFLSKEYVQDVDPQKIAKQRLKELRNFTVSNIKAMPIVEVDRHLAALALYIEAPEKVRRKVLWEWFNQPASDLVQHFNDKGKMVSASGILNNKFVLRRLILENPSLNYADFVAVFGNDMPTVTRASYNNARCLLKRAGYDIPTTRGNVVVSGPYGHPTKGKFVTTREDDNGEESFE